MPLFYYQARTTSQKLIEGKIEAENLPAAISGIARLGYSPFKIKPADSRRFSPSIKSAEIALWTRQLSDLLSAGVLLLPSLKILSGQPRNSALHKKIQEVHDAVKQGRSLWAALAGGRLCFSPLYVAMVRAGEAGNHLAPTLSYLAEFLQRGEELRSQVRMSLIYPALILSTGMLAIVVLLTLVIPGLTSLLEEFHASLPWPTLFLIHSSEFFRQYGWLVVFFIASAGIVFYRFPEASFKKKWERWQLKIPYLGNFIRDVEIARFMRTLAALLENGVVITEALKLASEVAENHSIRGSLERISQKVDEGTALSAVLKECAFFPAGMLMIIVVHEQSGHVEKGLFKVAEILEKETAASMKVAITLLEPMLIFGIGLVIGFIVLALLWPIFQLNLMVG